MHYPIMLWDRNKKYCRTFMFNRKVNNISLMLNLNQACLAKTIDQIVFPSCDGA